MPDTSLTTKTIRIACEGAGVIELDDLLALQGELKTLTDENAAKLTRELTETGFAFPFQLWRDPAATDGKRYIIDGHQRLIVLSRLRADGWAIPALPYNWVDAATKQEAMQRILQISSQYGRMTEETLREFLGDAGVRLEDYTERFRIPDAHLTLATDVDLDSFFYEDHNETKEQLHNLTLKFNAVDHARVVAALKQVDAEPEAAMLKIAKLIEERAGAIDVEVTDIHEDA